MTLLEVASKNDNGDIEAWIQDDIYYNESDLLRELTFFLYAGYKCRTVEIVENELGIKERTNNIKYY